MKNKLSIFEAISIISIITISQIILDYSEILIDTTGTGTIINLIFLTVITAIFCIIISKIFKFFSNQDIIDISEFIGGKPLKFIIGIIFIIFLLIALISTFSNFLFLVRTVYLNNSNFILLLIIFSITVIISLKYGFFPVKNIASTFSILLILSIIALLFGDNGNFSSNNLVPIFGYNYKTTFLSGISNIFIFNFIIIYLFLMPLLEKKNDYTKIVFTSLIINSVLIIISVISILSYYPTSITKELLEIENLNSLFLVTRRIQISTFLSQTDSIFVSIWCFAILNYILILLNGILYILNKLFNFENIYKLSFPVLFIIVAITLTINKIIKLQFLEKNIFRYFSIILTFVISLLILLLGYFKKRKEKNV